MKIKNLSRNSIVYTANAYLVTGTWNTLPDLNTMVDVGRDPGIIPLLENASTGVGKKKLDQVVLTHSHYDHAALLDLIREQYHPKVYAYSPYLHGVDEHIRDGDTILMGDCLFEVVFAPGHSSDSICLICPDEGVLFAGDAPLVVHSPGGTYEQGFIRALERLSEYDIMCIFFGHGQPLTEDCNTCITTTLKNVIASSNNS